MEVNEDNIEGHNPGGGGDNVTGEVESEMPGMGEKEEVQETRTKERDAVLFASLVEAFQEASSSAGSKGQRRRKEEDVHNLFTGSDEEQSPSSEVAYDDNDAVDEGGHEEEGLHANQEGQDTMIENNEEESVENSDQLEDKNSSDDVKKDNNSLLEQAHKVFVSNLPQGYLQSELLDLFQYYGKVLECEVFAKNYAFVYLEEEECALKAIEGLHGVEIRGCNIKVKRSWQDAAGKDNNVIRKDTYLHVGTFKIFMGHLPETVTKEQITGLLEPFGRVVEIEIRKGNRAFVHMETEDGGIKAMSELNGTPFPGTLHPIVVVESKNPMKPMLPIIKLKVTNIPVSVTADRLRSLFIPYGLVLNVKISTSRTECSYNTAIVHLEQFGNIRSAIKNLTGYSVDDGTLHVEPFFEKPVQEPAEPIHKPKPKLNSYKQQKIQPASVSNFNNEPYGKVSRNFNTNNATFNGPRPVLRQPYNRQPPPPPQPLLRLIPMPSRVELERFPGPRRGRGRVLVGQGFSNPGFQRTGFNDNPFQANPFETYDDEWTDPDACQEFQDHNDDSQYDEYDTYDHSSSQTNDYANNYTPPVKFPRKNSWGNNNGTTSYSQSLLEQQYGIGTNSNFSHNQVKDPFPDFPSPNKFPKPPPVHQSLMSVQIPTSDEQDWSADLSISTFSQFPQDFTSDEPTIPETSSSLSAVPFDYSQIRNKPKGVINQQFPSRKSTSNTFFKWGNRGGGGGKNKKSRPGLGTTQQQKKTATQIGISDNQSGTSSIPPLMGQCDLPSNPTPSYFQQNWSFSKSKQKQQFKKPSAKQMKDAEEEQKRQYADYLKQKPWLTTQIPGTIRRVEK